MAERQQAEEKHRLDALEQERQRQAREEMERVERAKKLEEERLQRVRDEQEKMRSTQAERKRMEEEARERAMMKAEEKQREEERRAGEKRKREEAQRRQEEEEARRQRKQEEETRIAQKREQEELRRAQQKRTDVGRSGVVAGLSSPQVTRRADDLHGLGFGQVRTGSVLSRKISLLTRAGSLEPEIDFTESPAPKRRTVRFAGLDSPSPTMPTGRRPKVETGGVAAEVQRWTQTSGWTGVVAQMDRDAIGQSPMSRRAVSSSPHPQLAAQSP